MLGKPCSQRLYGGTRLHTVSRTRRSLAASAACRNAASKAFQQAARSKRRQQPGGNTAQRHVIAVRVALPPLRIPPPAVSQPSIPEHAAAGALHDAIRPTLLAQRQRAPTAQLTGHHVKRLACLRLQEAAADEGDERGAQPPGGRQRAEPPGLHDAAHAGIPPQSRRQVNQEIIMNRTHWMMHMPVLPPQLPATASNHL